ncbi:MAG TPA: AMP-binding protein, partial [Gemmatimonadales bacterium]|nr:AMP-binding protein [Gemmatimonadales bacterium]
MTAHRDTFARQRLPPESQWPVMDWSLPELQYGPQLNAAVELLDDAVARGWGERTAIRFPGGSWSYSRLLAESNRVANVLTREFRLVPGNRVLLRGPNNAMLAACWFGVLKAGGICVTTMPLLRARELAFMCEKAEVHLALCDHRFTEELEHAQRLAPVLERIVRYGGNTELDKA